MLRGCTPSTLRFDGLTTVTVRDQQATELAVEQCLRKPATLTMNYEDHLAFLHAGLHRLSTGHQALDASRPWLIYWILHSLDLLGAEITAEERQSCIDTLRRCQSPSGGFGGGPGQLPHFAPSYAAVNALAILGGEALRVIDRPGMQRWISSMRQPHGGFHMHDDGELDIRGAYCAASIAVLCNLDVRSLFPNTVAWIASCQTFEGGFSPEPGAETHGGYAFCGLAASYLLDDTSQLNLPALLHWSAARQMALEGGFQGRVNKLVDGCYSFWVGGLFPILYELLPSAQARPLLHAEALADYVVRCCQAPNGGLRDKPGKSRDYYHTCYCLSGLATLPPGTVDLDLKPIHKAHNIASDKASAAKEYFSALPIPEL